MTIMAKARLKQPSQPHRSGFQVGNTSSAVGDKLLLLIDQSVAVIALRKALTLGSTSSAVGENLAISLAENIYRHNI